MSNSYDSFSGLSSPRRVMVPVLVRDGKPCHSGVTASSPRAGGYALHGGNEYQTSSGNPRIGTAPSYSDESLYNTSPATSLPGHLSANGLTMTYSTTSTPQFAFPQQAQAVDHLASHSYPHSQLAAQQFSPSYASSHLRSATQAGYGSAYAVAASYPTNYRPHQLQQKWPTW